MLFVATAGAEHLLWVTQFGTQGHERVLGLAVDSSGNSYAVGGTRGEFPGQTSQGCEDGFVAKVDASGTNVVWARHFGSARDEVATAAAVDAAGNVYVVGTVAQSDITTSGCQGEPADGTVRKYSSTGVLLWSDRFGTSGHDFVSGVAVEGDAVFVGAARGGSVSLRRYRLDGILEWEQLFGDWSCRVAVAADATGVYVLDSDDDGDDIVVRKFTLDGTPEWSRQLVMESGRHGQALGVAAAGSSVFVAGYARGSTERVGHPRVTRLTAGTGVPDWTRELPSDGWAWAVAGQADGTAYVTGFVSMPTRRGASNDAILWKVTPSGASAWVNQASISTSRNDEGGGVALQGNQVRVAGHTDGRFAKPASSGGMDAFVASVGTD